MDRESAPHLAPLGAEPRQKPVRLRPISIVIAARVVALLGAAAIVFGAPAPARADESCVRCHGLRAEPSLREPRYLWAEDVHGRNGVTCSDCHGGDPDENSARSHDLGRGFVARPGGLGTAQMCGGCHNGTPARPAAIESFRAGRHGRALAEDRASATCTSCHRAHGILARSEPRARALGGEVVRRCAACHSDAETMRASGLPTDQASQWERSVHGRAVAEGSTEAPDCVGCHDAHRNEAGLAAVRSCARCHEALSAAFARGPHAEHFSHLGFLDCTECHGSHEIRPAAATAMLTGINAVCTRCHGRGQQAFETVRSIAGMAPALARALEALPREDERRVEIVTALHALDAEGLARAIQAAGGIAAPGTGSTTPLSTELSWSFVLQVAGIVLLAGLAVLLLWRSRRLP